MPLINEIYDSLPYIDRDITPNERDEITSLLNRELEASKTDVSIPHPLLPPLPEANFTPAIEQELLRLEKNENSTMQGGIDLTRYEAIDPPSPNTTSDATTAWKAAITQASISHEYLGDRLRNLGLLEVFGRNAWLVGNEVLESVLGGLEREVQGVKGGVDGVVVERMGRQRGVQGEVGGLEGSWRRGVGRVVEGEVALLGVGREVLDVRRRRVGAGGEGVGGGGESGIGGGDRMVVDG